MEPSRDIRITLVDLLDRILDKGILINADLIISVANVPLIGVRLNAAIASIETMLRYGVMKNWNETQKALPTAKLKVLNRNSLLSPILG